MYLFTYNSLPIYRYTYMSTYIFCIHYMYTYIYMQFRNLSLCVYVVYMCVHTSMQFQNNFQFVILNISQGISIPCHEYLKTCIPSFKNRFITTLSLKLCLDWILFGRSLPAKSGLRYLRRHSSLVGNNF